MYIYKVACDWEEYWHVDDLKIYIYNFSTEFFYHFWLDSTYDLNNHLPLSLFIQLAPFIRGCHSTQPIRHVFTPDRFYAFLP